MSYGYLTGLVTPFQAISPWPERRIEFAMWAFDELEKREDALPCALTLNHDRDSPIISTESGDGDLEWFVDEHYGVRFRAWLPDNAAGRSVIEAFRSGTIAGISPSFIAAEQEIRHDDEGRDYTFVTRIDDLADIAIVLHPNHPHFPSTRSELQLQIGSGLPICIPQDHHYADVEAAPKRGHAARPRRNPTCTRRRRLQLALRETYKR